MRTLRNKGRCSVGLFDPAAGCIQASCENLEEIMPIRLPLIIAAILCLSWCATPPGGAFAQTREDNVNRPGGDFRNFPVNPPPPGSFGTVVDICRVKCERDGNCQAWTLVRAGLQGPQARCWLKNVIPAANFDGCCTSGVPMRAVEPRINRPGMDFNNFDLAAADPNLCKTACEREGICQAWTFVGPGVQGPRARCWLKFAVPTAFTDNCCTSGVRFNQPR
jgi:hypothetical protein